MRYVNRPNKHKDGMINMCESLLYKEYNESE